MKSPATLNATSVIEAIDAEPELPGEMPEEMWDTLRQFAYRDDREGMIEALRILVRLTKQGIKERLGLCTTP